ncbi:hypothetical protein NDU88_001299 [Pleurodeles waltl]|uniref:Uncharacterized protein n=1 Tax=Pleurodeles waltl TaxID=8319 RepID=A0AAV7VBH5_PLEWA|nr:hypothetical protein NDU88_001299 [Pleurodeles waltl]
MRGLAPWGSGGPRQPPESRSCGPRVARIQECRITGGGWVAGGSRVTPCRDPGPEGLLQESWGAVTPGGCRAPAARSDWRVRPGWGLELGLGGGRAVCFGPRPGDLRWKEWPNRWAHLVSGP